MNSGKSRASIRFDLQPCLQGKLVELRPLRPDDYEDLFRVASDPLLWEQHPARDRYQPEVFTQLFRESLDSGGALVIIDRESKVMIGSSRFHAFDEQASEIEIGWSFLARAYWGGTYNQEVKRLMIGHALRFVRRVVFLVASQNLRSQKAMEKLGAVRAGTRINAVGRDSILYEITAVP